MAVAIQPRHRAGRQCRRNSSFGVKTSATIEFGDFQTTLPLAREVCALLKSQSVRADIVIEPTCGLGSFLQAAVENYPKARLFGLDINHDHVATTTELLKDIDRKSTR